MNSKTLSQNQIQALDFQADQLYTAFKMAVETQTPETAIWSKGLNETFGNTLQEATDHSPFMDWKRDTQQAKLFDKYILHYALTHNASQDLVQIAKSAQYKLVIPSKERVSTASIVKLELDNHNLSYSRIHFLAFELCISHNFPDIVEVLDHVRNKYK